MTKKEKRKALKRKLVRLLKTWENCMLDSKTAEEILTLIEKESK
jgi:hypothetical protein